MIQSAFLQHRKNGKMLTIRPSETADGEQTFGYFNADSKLLHPLNTTLTTSAKIRMQNGPAPHREQARFSIAAPKGAVSPW
jgi:hypothetical protein